VTWGRLISAIAVGLALGVIVGLWLVDRYAR
jgi:hypothetical protein